METETTTDQHIIKLLLEQNLILQQQNKQLHQGRQEMLLRYLEFSFLMRMQLPPEERPQWVCIDEAAWLLGINLNPSKNHRRYVNWLHKNGELITTKGSKPASFLRTEVTAANQRLIDGTVVLPKTL